MDNVASNQINYKYDYIFHQNVKTATDFHFYIIVHKT